MLGGGRGQGSKSHQGHGRGGSGLLHIPSGVAAPGRGRESSEGHGLETRHDGTFRVGAENIMSGSGSGLVPIPSKGAAPGRGRKSSEGHGLETRGHDSTFCVGAKNTMSGSGCGLVPIPSRGAAPGRGRKRSEGHGLETREHDSTFRVGAENTMSGSGRGVVPIPSRGAAPVRGRESSEGHGLETHGHDSTFRVGVENTPSKDATFGHGSTLHGWGGHDEYDDYEDSLDDIDTETPRHSHMSATSPNVTPQRLYIRVNGKKFGSFKATQKASHILEENLDAPWVSFKEIPIAKRNEMFEKFKTVCMWDPANEYAIKETFYHVIADRYGDIMSESRNKSADLDRKAGHFIPVKKFNYEVMRDFPPKKWQHDLWVKLCERFNSEEFKKAQERGRKNRMSVDDSGIASRHTAGCIGFHEHRTRLQKNLNDHRQ